MSIVLVVLMSSIKTKLHLSLSLLPLFHVL